VSDPDVIRGALLFEDSYLFLMFASAVLVAATGLLLVNRLQKRALLTGAPVTCVREHPARRHIVGSPLFGSGWAIAAACLGPSLTQIGEGIAWAAFTAVGMIAGVYLFVRGGAAETEPQADMRAPDVVLGYRR
jgi:uncharacterized membrane protein YedE/YeeE